MIRPRGTMIRSRVLSLCEFRAAERAARPSGKRRMLSPAAPGTFAARLRSSSGRIMATLLQHATEPDHCGCDHFQNYRGTFRYRYFRGMIARPYRSYLQKIPSDFGNFLHFLGVFCDPLFENFLSAVHKDRTFSNFRGDIAFFIGKIWHFRGKFEQFFGMCCECMSVLTCWYVYWVMLNNILWFVWKVISCAVESWNR